MKKKVLLTPGPVTTTQAVKESMVVQDICPREDDFSKIIQSIRGDLLKVVNADENEWGTVLFASSGTGAMEACISSVVPSKYTTPTKKMALVLSNGFYGDRFLDITGSFDIGSLKLSNAVGYPLNLKLIEKILNVRKNNIGAVFMTHHETSTGTLNDIEEIGSITCKKGIPLVTDCVSSFGAVPIDVQQDKTDFIISTANKALQGMPGVSFVIFRKKYLNQLKWNSRSNYFNIGLEYEHQEKKGQMRFTAPVQVLYALRKALDELFKEGTKRRYYRYCRNYDLLTDGMHRRGFKSYLPDYVPRSRLIEAFVKPKNFNFKQFHDEMYKEGFTVYPGILDSTDTFRLGCIGDIKRSDIIRFFEVFDETDVWRSMQ